MSHLLLVFKMTLVGIQTLSHSGSHSGEYLGLSVDFLSCRYRIKLGVIRKRTSREEK